MKYSYSEFCACPECYSDLVQNGDVLVCTRCGVTYEFKNNIPMLFSRTLDDMKKQYIDCYKQIAKDDLVQPFESDRTEKHSVLERFVGNVSGRRVLDIGSSHALYLRNLKADFRVAFDIAHPYLEAIPANSGVVPVCGDAEKLPFKSDFFDVVIVSDILEHIQNVELLVKHLERICGSRTRLIVHVPWEEDIAVYRDNKYEFTHLRSFNRHKFAELWKHNFIVCREKSTYPSLEQPVIFRIEKYVPGFIYNRLVYLYYRNFLRMFTVLEDTRAKWIKEPLRWENWLLVLYKPKFRMFELRSANGTLISEIADVADKLKQIFIKIKPLVMHDRK